MSTEAIRQALAVQTDRADALPIYDALEVHRAALEAKVPVGVLTYAYAEAALRTELRANEKLRECAPASVLGAFSAALQLGLVPGPLQLVHFVPFDGQAVFLVGYRGYVELAHRSGAVKDVYAELVHEGDTFRVQKGTAPKIVHEPAGAPGERPIVAAYAVSHLRSGGTVFRVIYEDEWETARKASQLGRKNRGPWAEHFPAMVRKTAIRRLEPWLPKSPAIMDASTVDETVQAFPSQDIPGLVESATEAASDA